MCTGSLSCGIGIEEGQGLRVQLSGRTLDKYMQGSWVWSPTQEKKQKGRKEEVGAPQFILLSLILLMSGVDPVTQWFALYIWVPCANVSYRQTKILMLGPAGKEYNVVSCSLSVSYAKKGGGVLEMKFGDDRKGRRKMPAVPCWLWDLASGQWEIIAGFEHRWYA